MRTIYIACSGGYVKKPFEPEPTYLVTDYGPIERDSGLSGGAYHVWQQSCAEAYSGDYLVTNDPERFEAEAKELGITVQRVSDHHWHYWSRYDATMVSDKPDNEVDEDFLDED